MWPSQMMEGYSATKRSKKPDSGCILCDCNYMTFWKMQNYREKTHSG